MSVTRTFHLLHYFQPMHTPMTNLDQSKTVSGRFTIPPSDDLCGQLCLARTKSYLGLPQSQV